MTIPVLKATQLSKEQFAQKRDFQTVAENAPDIICRFDKAFRLLYVNPAIEKATGIPQDVFIGKNPLEIGMPKKFVEYWNKHIQFVFKTNRQTTLEFTFPSPEGERYYQSLLVPEFSRRGSVETVLSLSRDITIIKKLEKEKDEFISVASHELKTPITTVKVFAQILEKRLKQSRNTEEAHLIENITIQVEKLKNLVDDLLNVNKLESGRLEFRKNKFDLNALLKKIVTNFQYAVESHKILLVGKIKEKVYGDEDRIEQVVTNLITNAVKYSPHADKVIVEVTRFKNNAIVSVKDFGFGIAKKDRTKIFERFYRTTEKKSRRVSGFGLGLYTNRQ